MIAACRALIAVTGRRRMNRPEADPVKHCGKNQHDRCEFGYRRTGVYAPSAHSWMNSLNGVVQRILIRTSSF